MLGAQCDASTTRRCSARSRLARELAKSFECLCRSRMDPVPNAHAAIIGLQFVRNSVHAFALREHGLGTRNTRRGVPPSVSTATKPDAAGSSSPSTTSDVRSGAASYIASSIVACTFRVVDPQRVALHTHTQTNSLRHCNADQFRFGAHLVEFGPNLRQLPLYARLQVVGMKSVENEQAADQRILPQFVNHLRARGPRTGRQSPAFAPVLRRADPSATGRVPCAADRAAGSAMDSSSCYQARRFSARAVWKSFSSATILLR